MSATAPRVTVVVPVYNGERYLRESLESILAQTYRDLEVVVCDDASSDGTEAVIAAYGERVRSLRQEQNLGIYDNANAGIERARGELIAVYHADDVYDPAIVEREVAWLDRHPEAGAVFCLDRFLDAEGREYGRLELIPELKGNRPLDFATVPNATLAYKNAFLVCPTAMVRTSVYRALGGYRQHLFRNSSDLDMWLRIARRGPIGILDEHLLGYRHFHGSSAQRYHKLRTDPERYFAIMDHHLAEGGLELARPEALAAFEAHRAEDALQTAISHYIKGDVAGARAKLARASARRLLGSPRVQRLRLLVLLLGMHVLCRLPRSEALARVFYRRFHDKRPPRLRTA